MNWCGEREAGAQRAAALRQCAPAAAAWPADRASRHGRNLLWARGAVCGDSEASIAPLRLAAQPLLTTSQPQRAAPHPTQVRCLLRVSIYHVSYLRGLFPDNYFTGATMTNLGAGRRRRCPPPAAAVFKRARASASASASAAPRCCMRRPAARRPRAPGKGHASILHPPSQAA